MSKKNIVHVAVAVIKNSDGQYFIAKRAKNSHQGGLWEFPGGKVENNETVIEALKRELFEEVGIYLLKASALIQIHHDYADKSVFLDVFNVDEFTGEPFGKEGQEICWVEKNELSTYEFPSANRPIIDAIQLPDKYMITGKFSDEGDLLNRISISIKNGIQLVQFRAPQLDETLYFEYAKKIFTICEKENIKLLLNTTVNNYKKYFANKFSHGIHLTSKELDLYFDENFDKKLIVSTSTHNKEEISLSEDKKVSFIVLSPVNATLTHPDTTPLGWDKFKVLTEQANVPVYALGGMKVKLMEKAKHYGAQGIAAIGEFWDVE